MLNFFKLGKQEKKSQPTDSEASPELIEISNRISKMGSTTVKEIMIPRIDVVSLPLKSDLQEILNLIQEKGHSRIPIWDKSVDDIVGILYVKDLLPFFFQPKSQVELKNLLRNPHFIPESRKILSLLKEIQLKKNHIAIVVDEYGGVSGIVTLEDILEEIVGEIQDEYDEEQEAIIQVSDYIYLLDSRVYLEALNNDYHLKLPTDQADTIGGFVFDLFGKIPEQDEIIEFENVEFKITSIDRNRINKIKMTIKSKPKTKSNNIEPKKAN